MEANVSSGSLAVIPQPLALCRLLSGKRLFDVGFLAAPDPDSSHHRIIAQPVHLRTARTDEMQQLGRRNASLQVYNLVVLLQKLELFAGRFRLG